MWSDKEIGEVCVHDFVFLLLDFGIRVVRREDKVDLTSKRVQTHNPEIARVHLLLKAVRVFDELLVQLA